MTIWSHVKVAGSLGKTPRERFQARLDTDEFGRVLLYEGLWKAEIASPGQERA